MSKQHLKEFIGFGIAGNFAHHLDQAGEAIDFIDIKTEEENAPKGIFPFYLPHSESFLGTYPLSSQELISPVGIDGNLQLEPEMALIGEIIYDDKIQVSDLKFNFFTAYNDCSIRKEGAKKISEKKNWGENTKGISSQIIELDRFEKGGKLDSYHIASFMKRDGVVHEYGEDSPVITYNYIYGKLKTWIINKLNTQQNEGPLEDLSLHLKNSSYPKGFVISVGATSYTSFGESTFLQAGDEVFVYVYDSQFYTPSDIFYLAKNSIIDIPNSSTLHQVII